MTIVRHLERHLAGAGMSAVRLDTCSRLLRDRGRLPNEGRGLHAARISSTDAAALLLAYCGAGKGVRAAERLRKLEGLTSSADDRTLLATICNLIEEPVPFAELRISRIRQRARIIYQDGTEVLFARPSSKSSKGRFEVEAVVDAPLLQSVSALLSGMPTDVPNADEPEDLE